MKRTMSTAAALLLLSLLSTTEASQQGCRFYAATGESFTLPMGERAGSSDILEWWRNETLVVHRRNDKFIKGTKDDIDPHGALRLPMEELRRNTMTEYNLTVHSNTGRLLFKWSGVLCVIDKVPQPIVTHSCHGSSINFTCKVPPTQVLKVEWRNGDSVILRAADRRTISLQLTKLGSITCRVHNMVSSKTSQPVEPSCGFWNILGFDFWTMVAILSGGGVLVLLLFVATLVCCIRARRHKQMHLHEEAEFRLAWANNQPPQQQQHQHQHRHQQHHHHHPGKQQQQQQQQQPQQQQQQQQQQVCQAGPRQKPSKLKGEPHRSRRPDGSAAALYPSRPRPRPSPRTPTPGSRPPGGDVPLLPKPRKTAPERPRTRP